MANKKQPTGKVTILIGGQFGSEGKGVISAKLANQYGMYVRTGGANAGHTFIHRGEKWAMQVVPCGWVNYEAVLVFGAGGVLDVEVLKQEVDAILSVDPKVTSRLLIDRNCTVVMPVSKIAEGGVDGDLHARIGSTGKGVGHARIGRITRNSVEYPNFQQWLDMGNDVTFINGSKISDMVSDTVPVINDYIDVGGNVLIEGTQGSGLSLVHGDYPYVTSADTNAGQFAVDSGVAPTLVTGVLMVIRTFPIRVAGNSGALKGEIDWNTISERIGKDVVEKTTVTKKVRRIGEWDEEAFIRAVMLNRPTSIAVMFADYLSPEDEGKVLYTELSARTKQFVAYLEHLAGCPVNYIGTGGEFLSVVEK